MCGIVGLFVKNPALHDGLGNLLAKMLVEMTDRGPDSAGVAVYADAVADGCTKITVLSRAAAHAWSELGRELAARFGDRATLRALANHAVLVVPEPAEPALEWVAAEHHELHVSSSGQSIEIFKQAGLPALLIERFAVATMTGTHALGHTRMATESAVTTEHSHPFSTGLDLCLVHNGSLSNHNRLRRLLSKRGIRFSTDNDSEVAAGYLTWRLSAGDELDEALERALVDLDGFYTFAIGTRDGFAVLRDPIGCKPAIVAETDEWVAMASEFRAIAPLPGADTAQIWEPVPGRIYSWKRDAHRA